VTQHTRLIAQATARLTGEGDAAGTVATLLEECLAGLPVDAAGLLVSDGDSLELLGASSHLATEVELYQQLHDEGPGVDTVRSGTPLQAVGRDVLLERWPEVGAVVVEAGYQAVHDLPMTWRGQTFGALNLFSREPRALDDEQMLLAQALADLATLALARTGVGITDLLDSVRGALEDRVVVEQAKGVIVESTGCDPDEAYRRLVAQADGASLVDTAHHVVREAQRRD
jgi:transcriptional regulator with GAF, ATPase, and Fis domain